MTEPSAEEIAAALEEIATRATERAMGTWGSAFLKVRDCHTGSTWTAVRERLEKSHPAREIDACLRIAEKDRSGG